MTCPKTQPIIVTIEVPDPDAVLASYDQIQIWRSVGDSGGPYKEITGPGTRVALVSGVTEYEYEDPAGAAEFWYKFRFFNSTTLANDVFSEPQPGELDPALSIISVEELKTYYLFGLDLTNDLGEEYPDSLYAFWIKNAVSWLERKLDIPILPTVIEEERHDYYRDDYDKYIYLQLNRYPVISIEQVKMVLPGDQVVQTFEQDWVHPERHSGQLQLVPGTGTAGSILLGASGAWIPLIYGNNKFIPDAFRVAYTAGFGKPPPNSWGFVAGSNPPSVSHPDPQLDRYPDIIRELVGKVASFGPLNIAGDLLGGAGVASQSIGIDGLSQSFNTTSSATSAGYGARLIQYNKEIKDQIPTLYRHYHGNRVIAV
jgi:hypothetical protein